MSGHKILIVNDDLKITKSIELVLTREGYDVFLARDAEEALSRFYQERPDLVVLDLMLPGKGGYRACREIRRAGEVPLVLLAGQDEEVDKVAGFRLGADDYLTKPFSTTELLLRVRAALQRAKQTRPAEDGPTSVNYGELKVDRRTREVLVGGRPVHLTAKEFDLLWFLATHPYRVFSREQLTSRLWHSELSGDTNTITVLVRRLREKVEANPARPRYIRTIWGIGYKFVPPASYSA